MAFRTTRYLRSMLNGMGGNRSFASSTTPKMKIFTPTVEDHPHHHHQSMMAMNGEFAPVYMVLGMVMVALSIGAHTAKQQLCHSPGVRINKKKRESIPEVDDPDATVGCADKFLNKSFLRKVAHIQDHDRVLPDPVRAQPFTRSREVESLKSVGAHNRNN